MRIREVGRLGSASSVIAKSGKPNARVLPEPVGARQQTSRPNIASGIDSRWTSKGSTIPCCLRASTKSGSIPRSSNDTIGLPQLLAVIRPYLIPPVVKAAVLWTQELLVQRRISMATALPPPKHSVTMPDFASHRRITPSIVMRHRVPLEPSGCPRLTAPPWRLKRSSGMFSS